MKPAPPLLACCTLALVAISSAGVAAQTETRAASVYRCGPEGRDLRDAPCPGGQPAKPQRIEFEQPSSALQDEARQRARDEARQARELERQRLRHEASVGQGRAVGIDGLAGSKKASPATTEPAKPPDAKKPKTAKPKPPKTSKPPRPAASVPG